MLGDPVRVKALSAVAFTFQCGKTEKKTPYCQVDGESGGLF